MSGITDDEDDIDRQLRNYQWPNGRFFNLRNCSFQDLDTNDSLSLFTSLGSLIAKKTNVLLQGQLVPPNPSVPIIDVKTDVDGYCFNLNETEGQPRGFWMWEGNQHYWLEFDAESEDGKYASQIVSNYGKTGLDLHKVSGISNLLQMTNMKETVLHAYDDSDFHIKLKIRNYAMCISADKNNGVVVTYRVEDINNIWHRVNSFSPSLTPSIAPDFNAYNWPNDEGLTWRLVTDFKITCNDKIIAVHEVPFIQGNQRYTLHGLLKPVNKEFISFKVQIEVDVLYIQLEEPNHQSRGFWLRNVDDSRVFYKLDGFGAFDYSFEMKQCSNIFLLYDALRTSLCEKGSSGKLKIKQSIEQLHEESYESFELQYIYDHKDYVLTVLKDVVDFRYSQALSASIKDMAMPKTKPSRKRVKPVDAVKEESPEKVPERKAITNNTTNSNSMQTQSDATYEEDVIIAKFNSLDDQFAHFTESLSIGDHKRRDLMKKWWTEVLKILNEQYNGNVQVDTLLLKLVLKKLQTHSAYTRILRGMLFKLREPSTLKIAYIRWHVYAYKLNLDGNPVKKQKISRKDNICTTCNLVGHFMSECIVRRAKNKLREIMAETNEVPPKHVEFRTWCINCDSPHHYSSECKEPLITCAICLSQGHNSLYCTTVQQSISTSDSISLYSHVSNHLLALKIEQMCKDQVFGILS